MTTPADKRAEQYRQIHGLVRLLGMNDEAYRDMLRDRYQVESSKQLSTQQRSSLIKSLREQVHGKAQKFNEPPAGRSTRRALHSSGQSRRCGRRSAAQRLPKTAARR